ncbi:hypothetical protein JTE90_014488 [Oedothorax gibbosus]|uniref:Codanin-1 C-terminal domain-containing protein n=1 Tax=Oedothorax gibbosus TaxID=931172 RepID=A0AAV6VIX9_9ARAC|nr:hypothetical protein JTE90_014488 [Oedothorax gibbosus]
MEAIFKSVIAGKISLKDFTQWLDTNKSGLEELSAVQNFDFIPYFVNYVKENCSWLLNKSDKNIDIVNANKNPVKEIPSPKKVKSKTSPKKEKTKTSPKKDGINNSFERNEFPQITSQTDLSPQLNSVHLSTSKNIQTLNFGCAPYQLKRRDNRPFKENLQKAKFKSITSFPDVPVAQKCRNDADINNLDAFPPLGAKLEDPKARRRITPTPVQIVGKSSSVFGKSPFSSLSANKVQNDAFCNSTFQDGTLDLQKERDLLKLARDKLVKKPSCTALKTEPKLVDSNVIKVKAPSVNYIIPDPKEISMEKEMLVFIEIYNFVISKALIPNTTAELFFVFELITSKATAKDESKENIYFSTVHNCVYFAVSILKQQIPLLYMLDNTTLNSLCEIPYLPNFSPDLVDYLQQSLVKEDTAVSLPSLTRVPFQLDDDSRLNFSDESSFINFKKQRDMFYELLREWKGQSLQSDIKYQEKFFRKAKLLISLGPNTLNLYHLARLFQSQLIASCMCFEVNEVYDEILSDIQKNFPAKFKKLQERFLTPTRVGGLTPLPSFYGIQAFFSDLITATASPSFNQLLMDIFVSKIIELDNTDIFSDSELSSFDTLKDKYIFLLHTLRLLGKFLGYIHFLPYSSGQIITGKVAEFCIEARKRAVPPLDLSCLLRKASQNNHLILTVPWVVEYLSMMDSLALNLEHIQETLSILTDINKWRFPSNDFNSVLFFRLIIGWLFDVLHYPAKYSLLLQPISFGSPKEKCQKGLDSLALIDKQLIHSCCPYLIEFKVLIFNYLNDVRNKREARKITPFSTTQANLSSVSSKQQIESELEENFFSLHPQSLKKTCDFIADRIASKGISKIRSEVTNLKLKIVDDTVNSEAYKSIKASVKGASEKLQDIAKLLDVSVLGMCDDIRYKVQKIIDSASDDIKQTIPALVSEDTKQSVIDMCWKICIRIATNKITDWCDSNLVIDTIKLDIKSKVKNVFNSEPDIVSEKYLNLVIIVDFLPFKEIH